MVTRGQKCQSEELYHHLSCIYNLCQACVRQRRRRGMNIHQISSLGQAYLHVWLSLVILIPCGEEYHGCFHGQLSPSVLA